MDIRSLVMFLIIFVGMSFTLGQILPKMLVSNPPQVDTKITPSSTVAASAAIPPQAVQVQTQPQGIVSSSPSPQDAYAQQTQVQSGNSNTQNYQNTPVQAQTIYTPQQEYQQEASSRRVELSPQTTGVDNIGPNNNPM